MAHCVKTAPLQSDGIQNQNDPTIQCQMCNCATFESYLRKHIQYNHMIHRRNIVDILYKLHYPAELCGVQTQTANTWVTDLSLAHIDIAGCFREKSPARKEEPCVPEKSPVLCSVCGEIEFEMMIACDKCDGWYHWKCVGITEDPLPTDVWFCSHCINTEMEDNLPAEESQPSQAHQQPDQSPSQADQSPSQGHMPTPSSSPQGQNTAAAAGQKFSESQILIREKAPQGRTRITRLNQRDQNIVTDVIQEQPSTSASHPLPFLITDIPDNKEEIEDPFTEVVRRKRKKKGTRIQQQNRTVLTEPILTTEINAEGNATEVTIDTLLESSNDEFDIGNPQYDAIEDELPEFQEQKDVLSVTENVDVEKSKLKIINTFSVKAKQRNPTKSTRLGKRKEKKIGVLKLQEIIPTARKPLKLLIGDKSTAVPHEEIKDKTTGDKVEEKVRNKAVIVREIKHPVVRKDNYSVQSDETWKGKGTGKEKENAAKGRSLVTHQIYLKANKVGLMYF